MRSVQQKILLLFWMVPLVFVLTGCAELSLVSQLIEPEEAVAEVTPNAQPTEPMAVILLEPTPSPTPAVEETISQLVFVSDRGTPGNTDIYQINSDGSGLIQLTKDSANSLDPEWSPDRRQIAFTSDRTGVSQIYLLTLENLEETQLTEHSEGGASPTWSPNGEQIAFVEPHPDNDTILIVDFNGTDNVNSIKIDVTGIDSLAWAPNGNVIAFSAINNNIDQGDRDIFTIDLDSQVLVNLTNSPGDDDNPAWAPSGGRLAFQSSRNGNPDIFVMEANGALQTPLTDDPNSDVEPTWSSDGQSIAFSSDRLGDFNLFLMDNSGSNQRTLTSFKAEDRQPRWSLPPVPEIDEFLFAAGNNVNGFFNIFLVSSSGSKESEIVGSDNSDDTMPDWSPDGSKIVFASNRMGNYDLYWINTDSSGEPTQLTNHSGDDLHPAWSPDGTKIAFESWRDSNNWDIWVVNVDGSEQQNLTANMGLDQGNPAWSPDGQQIAFSSNMGSDFDIYVMNADGSGEVQQLTHFQGDEFFPAWSPDGRLIAFRGTSQVSGNRQIFIINSNGSGARPIFSDQFNNDTPSWSPDGQRIAFASDRANPASQQNSGQYDLYVFDLNTSTVEIITQDERDSRYPDWKPPKTENRR